MTHFDHAANEWDSEDKIQLMQKLAEKTEAVLDLQRPVDILDFGCGTGLFGLGFIDHANHLTGVDTSKGMLEVFDNKTKDLQKVESQKVDLEKGESISGTFDLIVSSMAFHHLNDPGEILGELKKSLKANGRLAIVDLDKEDGSFHPDPEAMGVKHFGFSKQEVQSWADQNELRLQWQIINQMEKNGKKYSQFLAVFS